MRNTIVGVLFVFIAISLYPKKVGTAQTKSKSKTPIVEVVVNPNDRLADVTQAEISEKRILLSVVQQEVIDELKKEKSKKRKPKVTTVYKTIYREKRDTIFLMPLDSNDYIKIKDCKKDTVYLNTPRKRKGIFKIFN